ncbi:alpha-1,2-fucosyltransferase [Polynucleobacter necessarius]|uniref:alpha-1,2-fucosyltransferase n=1 Tax=Polynucleobacter necessarius TaxID=576610 RepID=UPI000E0917B8|nr:alpha-1,2-fucosyltransferase [Polynucleobacter necessarius]
MIITKINGGLGNQFFQYAAGRALAHHHKTELVLDLSDLHKIPLGNTRRIFELDKYPIVARVASAQEELQFRFYHGRVLRRLPFLPRPWFYKRELHFQYDPQFFDVPNNVYLDGYWQSYLYFDKIGDLIRTELKPLIRPGEINQELMDAMRSQNSVALHIRRGDYLTNPKAAVHHGVCSLDYYQKAIERILLQVSNPHFYIFSDDIDWAGANLTISAPVHLVGHNVGDQSFQDLRLISNCKHQIIANSSFSWWGAWLNPNPQKIVIGPKNWFLVKKDTRTLFPPAWLII